MLKFGLIAFALISFVWYYYTYDPETGGNFFTCFFRKWTGYLCPGCGSQRSLHDLLHGETAAAYAHHPLLIIALPILLFLWIIDLRSLRNRYQSLHRKLINQYTIWFSFSVIILFWIGRNW